MLDQLLINKIILEDCTSKKKNLSTAWIDYQKAFDSASFRDLEGYVSPIVTKFVQQSTSMTNWKTNDIKQQQRYNHFQIYQYQKRYLSR